MKGIQPAADLHKDIALKVESWPMRRLESSRVIGSETDTSNKVIRASFGEDLVACVQTRLSKGGGGELGVVAPENDVAALSFPKLLLEVGNGASDVFLVCGVRGSHDVPLRSFLSPRQIQVSAAVITTTHHHMYPRPAITWGARA